MKRFGWTPIFILTGLLLTFALLILGGKPSSARTSTSSSKAEPIKIRLWHQLIYSHRQVQAELIREFEKLNPDIQVESLWRETEQLRSGFQSAAQVGGGPEIIQGPSDQVGPLSTMGLLLPLDEFFSPEDLKDFDSLSTVRVGGKLLMIGDSVGNHIALLYNRKWIQTPPRTTDELFKWGKKFKTQYPRNYALVWPMQEPFFFVPWISGFGQNFASEEGMPQLNTQAMTQALQFILDLKNSGLSPRDADYETANALFKEGRVAMIINGDWSWGDYRKAGIDFGVAPLPQVSSTGLWPAPLVATKGYSVNVNLDPKKREAVERLLKFLLSSESQLRFTKEVSTLPSRISARENPIVKQDPILSEANEGMKKGIPMPVAPELRAVWDALRTQYQAVLGGAVDVNKAGPLAQAEALRQIKTMNDIREPGIQALVVKILGFLVLAFALGLFIREIPGLWRDLKGPYRMAYAFILPALFTVCAVVVFPFFYNLAISFSNLGLRTMGDWSLTGFQNYYDVLVDPQFYRVFMKTLIWTGLNLFFHVGLGVFLALLINQTLPAKPLWRTLLIIPWAVPQYITALTWRGMFNQEFGAINQVLRELFHMPAVEWLSRPFEVFAACLITNIWLGFPFMMMVALGGLQSIPKELYEAARVDGANAIQRFRRITWPLLQPVLIPATVLGGIWTFNNLNVIWLVSNGGEPAGQTHILVSYVYKSAFDLYRYSYSAALSMIIFLILLGATIFYLRLNEKFLAKEKP